MLCFASSCTSVKIINKVVRLGTLVSVVVIVLAAVGLYFQLRLRGDISESVPQGQDTPWVSYRNDKAGFSFRYPDIIKSWRNGEVRIFMLSSPHLMGGASPSRTHQLAWRKEKRLDRTNRSGRSRVSYFGGWSTFRIRKGSEINGKSSRSRSNPVSASAQSYFLPIELTN